MKVTFSDKPIFGSEAEYAGKDTGAELIFLGRVRDIENGIPIVALEYEYYPEMAEKKLTEIAHETMEKFDIQNLECTHRIGPVATGEVSVRIVILSRNRKSALRAMQWFIDRLKSEVPVWKWGIAQDGKRFPSDTK